MGKARESMAHMVRSGKRDSVTCRVIEALQPHVKLSLNVASTTMRTAAIKYMVKYEVDTSAIEIFIDPYIDFFARDYIFLQKTKPINYRWFVLIIQCMECIRTSMENRCQREKINMENGMSEWQCF